MDPCDKYNEVKIKVAHKLGAEEALRCVKNGLGFLDLLVCVLPCQQYWEENSDEKVGKITIGIGENEYIMRIIVRESDVEAFFHASFLSAFLEFAANYPSFGLKTLSLLLKTLD